MLGRHLTTRTGLLGSLLSTRGVRRAETEARRAAEEVIDLLELEEFRNLQVGTLSYGIRKRIERIAHKVDHDPAQLFGVAQQFAIAIEHPTDLDTFSLCSIAKSLER